MVRLILLGPPGGGKGTQAQTLAKLWQIPHISTGEILRTAVADQTSLGVQAQSYMERGELVPDNLVVALIQERLSQSDAQAGWVLDGFPRNVAQADSLENLLEKMHQAGYCVVNLDVPNEVLITRLLNRGRQDDTEVVVQRRLEVYQEQTAPLINFYRDCQRLININGNAGIEDVMAAIKQSVDTFDHSAPQS